MGAFCDPSGSRVSIDTLFPEGCFWGGTDAEAWKSASTLLRCGAPPFVLAGKPEAGGTNGAGRKAYAPPDGTCIGAARGGNAVGGYMGADNVGMFCCAIVDP